MKKIHRALYTGAGILLVGFGFLGIVVPGVPTTIFLILALFCFQRGNERFERWLLNHPRFGPTLRDWAEHRAIKRRTKIIAIATIWAFMAISLIVIPKLWVKLMLVGIGLALTAYLWTRRNREEVTDRREAVVETAPDRPVALKTAR